PQGEVETTLAQIWQDLLKIERVGRHDHFFELGGHSLLAVSLIGRMRQVGLSADVRVLFGQPTLMALAAAVGSGSEIQVPDNGIQPGCTGITPSMLPLVELDQQTIDRIVDTVPGGAANVQDIYPLAPLQEGIFFHHLSAEQGDLYVLQSQFAFDHRERLDAFVEALQGVIDRHDILRTSVVWEGLESPVQVVWREAKLHVEAVDLDPAAGDAVAQLQQRFDPRHHRLDVSQAPLMRLAYGQDAANHRLVATLLFHHMALDHTALEVVQYEMQAHLMGDAGQLADAVPYRNYVAQARLGMSREEHEVFFREMLGDVDEPTLPFGLQDVQGGGHGIEEAGQSVEASLDLRLRAQARQLGVSVASLVHLAWAQVLGKVSGKQDVVFGTVLMGRMQGGADTERALGMFINTLPLRVQVGQQGVRAGVKAVHARLTSLLGHEHASLALAQRCSGVAAPLPLFSALLNYRHSATGSVSAQATDAWQGIHALNGEERTNYPLTLNVDDLGNGFSLTVLVAVQIGAQRVCGYMHTALEKLVEALEQTPQAALYRLPILPEAEREQLLVTFNATDAEYPLEQTVHGLFEEQVQRTPDALAVLHGDQRLSYAELNERANQLAHYLRGQGVRPDSRVAICVERGLDMVVGLLAILKAGGGYVPLDPAYPADRIAYMLEDSAPAVVLAQTATVGLLADASMPVIDLGSGLWQDESVSNPQVPELTSSHLAYVIYTSGSTGLPKGVMIEHRNTVNFLTWAHRSFDAQTLSKTLFSTSLNFDLAVYECFAPLTSGGSIEVVTNVLELQQGEHDITLINTVPSALKALLESGGLGEGVDTVNVAGEALKRSLVEALFEQTSVKRLCNLYGPSETTTYSSWVSMVREDGFAAHIGKPVANTQFYLLDEHKQPVPLGVPGEIYIGGAGVARGYLNRDDLTAERFLKDPFSREPNARMYKTGDLGRYLADGNIEYLGRNDDQVKIRGFRIELGEIEAKLAQHDAVKEAVVLAREDVPGDKRLVAYFTQSEEVDIETLRSHLQAQLPAYMVPVAYVHLDALPLTPNGKLDRKALPAPEHDALITRGYEAPQGEVETTLAQIWQDLLKVERVGRHDHFFELGGHSLLAVSLIGRMRQVGLSADVRVLFGQPTLMALAAAVGSGSEIQVPDNGILLGCTRITPPMLPLVELDQHAIDRIVDTVPGGARNVQDIYPLAPLQEGILYHHIAAPSGDPYVLQATFTVADPERLDAFAHALQGVIDRHDILRTSVVWEGLDEPVQVVWRKAQLAVEEVVLAAGAGDIAGQLRERFDTLHYRLDMQQAPLMRIAFAEDQPNQRWVAILLFHHMALDHTALELVRHEMQAHLLGQADQLGEAVPFRNYVAQARRGVSREEHEAFFRDMLGDVDEPTLPFGVQDVRGDGSDIEEAGLPLSGDLSRRLRAQARELGVSAASLHHLAWAQVLGRVSGKQDVVFGTVLMGRMQGGDGAERALGMFINTLPLRVDVGTRDVRSGVKAAHARLTGLLGHEHASLALAQRCSGVVAPMPLFSALLNYRHSAAAVTSNDALAAWDGIEILSNEERTNYPLTLSVDDLGEDFLLTALAVPQIGAQRVCAYMNIALEHLVKALEQAPQTCLDSLSILPPAERRQLLVDFNATTRSFPRDRTVHGLFEAQVQVSPEAPAVVHNGQSLAYAELNGRANRLARHLIDLGIKPGERVAILLERSIDLLVSQLAVLKCAAVYVPLDIHAPLERQEFMVQDSGARILLTLSATTTPQEMTRVDLDTVVLEETSDDLNLMQSAESVAYIMYTSGSTGMPKGVLVPHRAINRLVINNGYADFNQQDRVAFASNPAFDASTLDVWAPLLNGGCVVVVEQDVLLSREHFAALLTEQSVSVLWMTAGLFHQYADGLLPVFKQLRYLIVGGDVLDPAVIARVLKDGAPQHLLNGYGPTEATTFTTTYEIKGVGEGGIPIGHPIGNTRVYVLDANQQPVPVGVAGELYIGGDGVAKGYLNRPELTAEKFVADPFSADPAALLYRTGDLARWRADGAVDYLGRNDDQVKIRGFRIELGEIEARLGQCAGVKDAVVLARQDDNGPKRLVGYVIPEEGVTLSVHALRSQLASTLAEYMVPSAFVVLPSFPLTANGKLDRRALPAPDAEAYASREYEAPQGEVEQTLARLWAEVLKVEQIGRHDHFFELGGHSLLAVTLIERMRQAGLSADVRVLFSQPTLAALAAAIGSGKEISVPENRIPSECEHITPELLPLVNLTQDAIDRLVSTVPGGARNVQDIYPLAPLQEGILYHHLAAEQGDPYVLQSQFAFDSFQRFEAFVEALQVVIDRHDILRTSVAWEGLDEPLQMVWRKVLLEPQRFEADATAGDVATQLASRFDARHYRLDLRRAPMLQLIYAQDEAHDRWLAILLFHHMALDHTALDVMQHEMQLHLLGQGERLGEAMPYRNYVAQARLGASEAEHEAFFRDMLGDIDEPTLPFGLQDVQGDGHGIDEIREPVDLALSRRLRAQARQLGVSAASLVHLAWAQVLGKVSGSQEVVFGTVLLGRMQGGEGADRALGMFINTLPLRVDVGAQDVRTGVKATHARLTELLGHEHASLALAQRCSGVAAPTPLFSALLNYRHSAAEVTQDGLSAWNGIEALNGDERTNYPLTLNVDDLGEGFSLTALVDTSIGAARICGYMQMALDSLVTALEQAPHTALHALTVLPPAERRQLLETWNTRDAEYTADALIHRQFEAWAMAQPDAVAVIHEEQTLTYGQLNARANQLAHSLLAEGIRPDDRVAICVERGLDMIVGLLGILKAGAGYVPLDPAYPAERIAYMLHDSSPVALVTQREWRETLPPLNVPTVLLDPLEAGEMEQQPRHNPDVPGLEASHLAYVIYTSGSTGLPKGVMVEHRNVARLFSATQPWFDFGPQDVWALFHSFAFDFSVWEIWGALTQGGRLLVVPQLVSRSPQYCYALLCEAGVTILNQTPSAFRQLIAAQGESDLEHSLRQVIFGGEALETGILKPWYAREINARTQLVNMYGITETTVHVTYRALCAADAQLTGVSPIGKRIPDLQLYVLDAQREPVPVGVVGEMYVGGAGVSRGYLNRDELTAERFLDNPFSDEPNARMYKTGDLGRWLADGSIEYLGRNDDQVKIRGFRIELGEIEAKLAACNGVREAVVLARQDIPGDQRLVAYVIAEEGEPPSAAELRAELLGSLAEYMVPSAFVMLTVFPLTTNGKLDRKALPVPDQSSVVTREYEAPQGEVETAIARIWQELLQVEQVGRHDHFFEMGGHSLLAVKLVERMRQIDLAADVRVLFGQPTLAALAAAVGGVREIVVPANLIPVDCSRITPDMLPLVDLDQDGIDRVVASVPGGVGNVQDIYALAPLQEGILYHHLAAAQGDPYLQYVQFTFDSRSRLDDFARALQSVVSRHDILRTGVVWEGLDEPVQVVWREAQLGLDEVVLDPAAGDIAQQLREHLDPRHYRLDIRQAPMMRIGYAEDVANNRWVGMLLFHHMVDDATSLAMLTAEIEAHVMGREHLLAASVPYRNYVAQARLGISREEHEGFFREMLGDVTEPTLPFGLQDVQGDGRGIEEVRQPVDGALSRRLRTQARQLGVSAASLYHLAWAQVLGRVSGKDDVVFGTVLLGRMQGGEGADRALGMFINTLPLRVELGAQGVRAGVKATHARLTALLGHEHASLVLAQRCSGVTAPAPLFSALLNYRHLGAQTASSEAIAAWEGIQVLGGEERTNYPLSLSVDDLGEDFNLTVMAQEPIGAGRICNYVQTVLEHLVQALEQSPLAPLHGLQILPPAERRQLLETWNAADVAYADNALIHGQFEACAAAQPDAVAVVFESRTLTYGELNNRANQLAHHLLALGIRPDDRVAICVERGLDMIVGLLGILKAGAGYVPLDPAYPTERLAYLLQDSAPVAVLVQTATRRLLADISLPVVDLEGGDWQAQSVRNPQVAGLNSSHLAYVIYTSGSTGLPKGVMVEHRNVARLFSATQPWFDFGPQDVWALFHSFAFDFSVWEIWGALTHGGRLLVVPQLVSRSPQECYALLCQAGVTVLNQTPSAFRQLIAAQGESELKHSLRQVIFGGEALETGILKPWYAREINAGTQLVNMYGITETTVHVTYRALCAADAQLVGVSPIGGRIPDLQLYVLDAQREPVPVGVVGEMYVGGAGVSRGYLNRDELTAERFLKNPFSDEPNARMYKTGDLGRWLADGSIEYLGRNDDQVKIRGFRIELGEIEAALATCDGVSEAVVIAREDEPGDKRLVAYVIAKEDAQPAAAELRTQLLGSLADYMVPSAFVMLEAFPLTTNGKLDRKALPAPDQSAVISREYEAPQGEVESAIARIWQDLLKLEQVGRHDNFFELGGHSLLAVKLIERMRQMDLSADVRVLFSQPTLAALAAAVGGHTEVVVPENLIPDGCTRITPDMLPLADLDQEAIDRIVATVPGGVANVQDIYALAPLQEGILYHHLAAEQGDPYVLQVMFGFDSRERLQAFAQALQSVVSRNDILRTSMAWQGLESPVQVVWRHATLALEEVGLDPAAGDAVQQLHERFDPRHYRLDIAQAPLMRLAYAQDLANQRWVGMLLFHHVALDHTALEVVVHEMQASLLDQAELLAPAVPYRNHVAQARLGVSREQHEAFFRDMLGDIDEPTLPFGLLNVQGDGSGIEEVQQGVDAALAQRLRAQARQLGVSAASLVHLAWAQVVGRVSGREEVVFGTVLMGRMQGGDGADRALGMFINTLPLRVSVGHTGVRTAVKATHARLSGLLGHEHASLALAQRCSGVPASLPLFSTLLNYRHSAGEAASEQAISAWHGIHTLGMEERTNYPLCLNVDDLGEGFLLTAQAVVEVGAQRVCGYMHMALESLVQALEHAPDAPLRELSIVPADEREQLLVAFNATEAEYPLEQTIHGLFEEQVRRTPDALAVRHGRQQLNYRELNGLANRLAHYLRKQGVQPDSRVAICVERGIDMVVGLLAILKAGGGYVPLDPAYPADRIAYMLEDSAPAAILVQAATRGLLGETAVPVIDLDRGVWQDETAPNPLVPGLTSAHLAYVIYTSGSTGLPKGVMIEHRNTVNFLTWAHRSFDAQTLSKTLFSTSLNFDLAVYECFAPLTSGGSIEVVTNVLELQHGEHDITLINTVPSALKALLEAGGLGEGVDTVNVAGEALKRSLVEALFEQTAVKRLCNLYGPSETTTYSSWVSMAREDGFAAHIGKPVANTQFYLLDEHKQPVPLGVPGEIYIGGAGVARGYLNRDDLTAERFLNDPFSNTKNARMYKTGDLGRYLPDGNIEYLGRNDDQVKIRGFRIELGEIEAKLAQHDAVKEAVVLAREDVPGDKRLVAYFTQSEAVDIETLRSHLQAQLPEYMVPVAYVHLDAMPLTPNGKLDRKALPAPDLNSVISRGYEAPQGEVETVLAKIWQDLLGLQQVGRHDQFFELGGHSLLAMQLISQVRLRLGVELSLTALFAHPALMDLAQAVSEAGRSTLPEIVRASRDESLPLSFAQQRLWFLAQMEGASAAYHMPAGLRLRGTLDRVALQRALDRIVARHEALRTTFVQAQGEEPRQCIAAADSGFALLQHDFSERIDAEAEVHALAAREAVDAFDLEHGPLIRGRLIRLGDEEHVLLVTMHHIVSDAWSMGVLVKELVALYEAFRHDLDDPLPALAVQYGDYALWQRRWLSGEVLQAQSSYWRQTLADAPALLMLPTDRARPAQQDYSGAALPLAFDAELTAHLKALSQRHGVTLYMTLMAAWAALLSRLCGQDDVVIGSPVANRTRSEVEGLIGFFVNTLAVRIDVSGAPTVEALLARVRNQTLGAQAHQDLPFEQVVEVLNPVRSLSHSPLFQAMLSWQTLDNSELALGDLKLESLGVANNIAKFDLSLELGEAQGQIFGALEYATALFDEATVQRYLGYFERMVRAMVASDQTLIEQIALVDDTERQHLLVGLNANQAPYPCEQTIHQLFEAQVATRPQAIAVVFEGERLSYAELNRQANQLAHHLIGLGIRPDDRVAICVERSAEMLVGLLAVLKAGGGYVPLDPAYPAERLAYMIADSAPVALLTQRALQGRLPSLAAPVVLLDYVERVRSGIAAGREDNPVVATLGVRHLAYVIYTSGSTGAPKGVMIEHRGLVNYCVDAARLFELTPADTVLQQNTLNFDLSVEEIFPALIAGATLAPTRQLFGSVELRQDLGIRPTFVHLTAAHWHSLAAEWHSMPAQARDHLRDVRLVNVTGDALSMQKLQMWDAVRPAHTRLINTYGPTEATVSCTAAYMHYDADGAAGNATIGTPMANTRIYLLDGHRQPVPFGVAGEIYIGGDGVARGYLNLDAINAERFLLDPFSDQPDARMYKTGDLARYRPDGRIEYLGRNDFQVKVRGFRIELGEIETRLGHCAGVKEAAVIVREDTPGDKRLVAYVVLQGGVTLSAAALRSELSTLLAEYMVPSAFVSLAALPLTPNRKLDRQALPAPDADAFASRVHVAPQGATEVALARIWQGMLNVEVVGRHDHFFELGGHSLLVMRLIAQVREQLGVELSLNEVFAQPELSALAQVLARAARSARPDIVPVSREQALPLSFAQQRLWFLAQLDNASAAYHIPTGLRLRGALDTAALGRALDRIVARHEALRTTFVQGQEVEQRIAPADIGFALKRHDLSAHPDAEAELSRMAGEEAQQAFDLSRGPLARGRLVRMGDADHALLVTLHHIVSDGWSADVLTRELGVLYAAFSQGQDDPLPALPVQYADYAIWQRRWLTGEVLSRQERYWQDTLAGAPALLTLPTDRPRPAQQDHSGHAVGIAFDEALTEGLKALSQRHGATLFMTVMAAWAALLSRMSGQDDVVIGTPTANRMQAEVEDLIGLFVNTLAVRVEVSSELTVETLLQRVKAQTLGAQAHQDLPFEQVVEVVRPLRSLSHSPVFQAMLSWQNNETGGMELSELSLQGLGVTSRTAKFDVLLDMALIDGRLFGSLEYATALFDQATMERYLGYLECILRAMVADEQALVAQIPLLQDAERQHLLEAFNATAVDYPQGLTLHGLFEARVT
ncbi:MULTISPECIES: non-ribosomal peptide synthase/polyketide synthase, partial [unclassified Pseudomonas]|uniref:non-ribosomal peptide synthase/polyketide synthase n=1 Tax=unclassified Pseudomonas TaxID=196821 RepID=UPI0011A878CD